MYKITGTSTTTFVRNVSFLLTLNSRQALQNPAATVSFVLRVTSLRAHCTWQLICSPCTYAIQSQHIRVGVHSLAVEPAPSLEVRLSYAVRFY